VVVCCYPVALAQLSGHGSPPGVSTGWRSFRGADHRELYAIGFDVDLGARAPRNGTVTLRQTSSGTAGSFTHWLTLSLAEPPSIQRTDMYSAQSMPVTHRERELPETIARHVFEVLWWLSRLRTDSTARGQVVCTRISASAVRR